MTRSMLQPNVKAELRPGKAEQSREKEGETCSLHYLLALLVAVILPVNIFCHFCTACKLVPPADAEPCPCTVMLQLVLPVKEGRMLPQML